MSTPMALTMRPAGLSSGIDQDRADYTVFCGERIAGSYGRWRLSRAPKEAFLRVRAPEARELIEDLWPELANKLSPKAN